jgi:hypothetical protein
MLPGMENIPLRENASQDSGRKGDKEREAKINIMFLSSAFFWSRMLPVSPSGFSSWRRNLSVWLSSRGSCGRKRRMPAPKRRNAARDKATAPWAHLTQRRAGLVCSFSLSLARRRSLK